jgi:hypothetical protein
MTHVTLKHLECTTTLAESDQLQFERILQSFQIYPAKYIVQSIAE